MAYWLYTHGMLNVISAPSLVSAESAAVSPRHPTPQDQVGNLKIAYGPLHIDDEAENEFHERICWLLIRAVDGKLSAPKKFPFNWPPLM
jgi:hypothetical protein